MFQRMLQGKRANCQVFFFFQIHFVVFHFVCVRVAGIVADRKTAAWGFAVCEHNSHLHSWNRRPVDTVSLTSFFVIYAYDQFPFLLRLSQWCQLFHFCVAILSKMSVWHLQSSGSVKGQVSEVYF